METKAVFATTVNIINYTPKRMNAKNAAILADRLTSDEQSLKDLEAHSSSPEAIEAFLKSEGYEFTEPELLEALRLIEDLYSKASLSNAELEGVSGGSFGRGLIKVFGKIKTSEG